MVGSWTVFYKLLGSWSWWVEACVIEVFLVWVWEHVVVLCWPCHILCFESIYVCRRGRLQKGYVVLVMFVEVPYRFINLIVVKDWIEKAYITTPWDENILRSVRRVHLVNWVNKEIHIFVAIKGWKSFISLNWSHYWVKERWQLIRFLCNPAVVISRCCYEYLFAVSEMLWEWSPEELKSSVLCFLFLVFEINSFREKQSFKSKISK